ncbi:MAG: phosphotransferase [Victivallales bacterium]|nr:phosphotransferase [Victivallales bacterium]
MDECREILESCYPDIGIPVSIEEGGGTAGHCWRIATTGGKYLLRRRGRRTSEPSLVQRDHAFRRFLVAGGIPTSCALPGRGGDCYFIANGFAYELHPFVEGRFMQADSADELRNLASCLARFHKVAAGFRNQCSPLEFNQFGAALPDYAKRSSRIDDPEGMFWALKGFYDSLDSDGREKVAFVLSLAEKLAAEYGSDIYAQVDDGFIHGDLNLTNILFAEDGSVAGLFDFDWAMPGARIRDVADALHFFAGGLPKPFSSNDIWGLTQIPRFNGRRTTLFLDAYNANYPLSNLERKLLLAAWEARVLAFHIEGMAKVPLERRIEFLTREMPDFVHHAQTLF